MCKLLFAHLQGIPHSLDEAGTELLSRVACVGPCVKKKYSKLALGTLVCAETL